MVIFGIIDSSSGCSFHRVFSMVKCQSENFQMVVDPESAGFCCHSEEALSEAAHRLLYRQSTNIIKTKVLGLFFSQDDEMSFEFEESGLVRIIARGTSPRNMEGVALRATVLRF
jgi:hypothetical protein